jgi:protein TonB
MELKKSEKANLEHKRGLFTEIGLVVVLAAVLIAFEWTTKPSKAAELDLGDDMELEEEIIPITRQQDQPPPPPPEPPQVIEVLNIVEDDVELEDELDIGDMEADQDLEIDLMPIEMDEEEAEEEVFFIVEDMPKFRGKSYDQFRTYIAENLRYPEIAAENGISGRVFVQFTVNSKGSIVDVVVVRGVDPALDKEAIRVVKTSPTWTPGKQRGRPVNVRFTFPIVFVLQ